MINAVGDAAKHSFSRLERFEFEREDARDEEVEIEAPNCGVRRSDIHQAGSAGPDTVRPCPPGHAAPDGRNMYGKDNSCGGFSNVLVVREDVVRKRPDGLRAEVAKFEKGGVRLRDVIQMARPKPGLDS